MFINNLICNFLNNSIIADWAVAFSTILLAIITIFFHFVGDSYTRLIKNSEINKFNKLAYDFLKISFASFGLKDSAQTSQELTVGEFIDKFRQDLIENKIYMGWIDKRRFKRYVKLAMSLAKEHDFLHSENKFPFIRRYQEKILADLKILSKKIGQETEFNELKNNYEKTNLNPN